MSTCRFRDTERRQHRDDALHGMTAAAMFRDREQTISVHCVACRLSAMKPLTCHDGFQLFHGMVKHIVDENIAIFVVVLNLHASLLQAALDGLFRDTAL